MLSKEEIFEKHMGPVKINGSWEFDLIQKDKALAAMDEYAKQEAIGFAKFLDDLKINADKHFKSPRTGTTDELYDYYLKTKGHAPK